MQFYLTRRSASLYRDTENVCCCAVAVGSGVLGVADGGDKEPGGVFVR